MATQRINITDLFQGTSDQHPSKQRPGQVDPETSNIRFSISSGACKRNGTDLVADLALDTTTDWHLGSFKRRYLVAISSGSIKVYDMADGSEETVVSSTGDFSYLSSSTGPGDIRTAGLLETLVILNRRVTTAANTTEDYEVAGDVITYDQLFQTPDQASLADGADDPTAAQDGDVFEVFEIWNDAIPGFYQKSIDGDDVNWTLIAPPNDANAVPDETTLPHRLVHDIENDRFVYEPCPWVERLSGNDETNPAMPWFGETLDCIAAHSGRLFFFGAGRITSGEQVTLRHSAFNLYDFDVATPLDTDRIEFAVTDSSLGDVLYASSLGNDLVVLHENGVNLFTSGSEQLNSLNGRDFKVLDTPVAEVRPTTDGASLFYIDEQDDLHWLGYEGGSTVYRGSLNDHRPELLRGETLVDMYAVGQVLFLLTESGTVKTLARYSTPGGNFQLAWGDLAFYERPAFVGRYNDQIKILTEDSTEGYSLLNYLHREPIFIDEFSYEICLDRREAVAGSYDFSKDETMFLLTGRDASLADTTLVLTTDPDGNRLNQPVKALRVKNNKFFLAGKWDTATHYIGFNYDAELVLSKLWAGASKVVPLLSEVNVIHKDATDYDVEMTVQGESAELNSWSAAEIGLSSIGTLIADTGSSTHWAGGDAKSTTIKIKSSSAGYFEIPAIEMRVRTRGRS